MKESEMKPGVYVRVIDSMYTNSFTNNVIGDVLKITLDNLELNPENRGIFIAKYNIRVKATVNHKHLYWADDLEVITKEEAAMLKLKS